MISICDINSDISGRTNECKICDLNSIDVDLNSIEVQAKLKFEFLLNFYLIWELMSQTMEWGPSEITHVIDVTSQLMNSPLFTGPHAAYLDEGVVSLAPPSRHVEAPDLLDAERAVVVPVVRLITWHH